jgi:hypothetical protein
VQNRVLLITWDFMYECRNAMSKSMRPVAVASVKGFVLERKVTRNVSEFTVM